MYLAFLIDDPMEGNRSGKLSRCDQLGSWFTDVGDIDSPSKAEVLRAFLLHPPALRCLRRVPIAPRRRLRLQHRGRRRLPIHARPLPEVRAIQGQSRHCFCGLPPLWNCGASLLEASKSPVQCSLIFVQVRELSFLQWHPFSVPSTKF
ncbi:hypothetical protein ACQ4PT_040820 [Festuca glaucescens]